MFLLHIDFARRWWKNIVLLDMARREIAHNGESLGYSMSLPLSNIELLIHCL